MTFSPTYSIASDGMSSCSLLDISTRTDSDDGAFNYLNAAYDFLPTPDSPDSPYGRKNSTIRRPGSMRSSVTLMLPEEAGADPCSQRHNLAQQREMAMPFRTRLQYMRRGTQSAMMPSPSCNDSSDSGIDGNVGNMDGRSASNGSFRGATVAAAQVQRQQSPAPPVQPQPTPSIDRTQSLPTLPRNRSLSRSSAGSISNHSINSAARNNSMDNMGWRMSNGGMQVTRASTFSSLPSIKMRNNNNFNSGGDQMMRSSGGAAAAVSAPAVPELVRIGSQGNVQRRLSVNGVTPLVRKPSEASQSQFAVLSSANSNAGGSSLLMSPPAPSVSQRDSQASKLTFRQAALRPKRELKRRPSSKAVREAPPQQPSRPSSSSAAPGTKKGLEGSTVMEETTPAAAPVVMRNNAGHYHHGRSEASERHTRNSSGILDRLRRSIIITDKDAQLENSTSYISSRQPIAFSSSEEMARADVENVDERRQRGLSLLDKLRSTSKGRSASAGSQRDTKNCTLAPTATSPTAATNSIGDFAVKQQQQQPEPHEQQQVQLPFLYPSAVMQNGFVGPYMQPHGMSCCTPALMQYPYMYGRAMNNFAGYSQVPRRPYTQQQQQFWGQQYKMFPANGGAQMRSMSLPTNTLH